MPAILFAAVAGLGLAYVPADMAQPYLNEGVLESVLEDWCLPYSGYRLYYPSRRHRRRHLPCWSRRCAIEIETDDGR